jgi:hypothetical protein
MRSTYSSKPSLRFCVFLSFFFLLSLASADSHVRIVRVSSLNGDVQVDRADGQGFDKGILNMPIVQGARVWTRNDGRAEIEFEDGSTIRLVPNTIINFDDLSLTSSGNWISKLSLQEGTAYFDLQHREHDVFEIAVGHHSFEPLHSSHFRIQSEADAVNIAVFKGDLRMTSATLAQVEVRKGETLTLDNTDPGRYFLAKNVDNAPYDDWDQDRREYRDRYSAQVQAPASINYGFSDLSYYGTFADIPGCGNCWRPHSASLGWDPFLDGSWIYYPNVGWTFVSAYPWGWTPYRYGQWVFVSGYGYCWRPGHTWHNWTPTPVVVTATRGPVPPGRHPVPLPPSRPTGGNSGVVAVGRGPTTGTGGPVRGFVDDDMPRGPRRLRGDNDDDGFTRGRPGNPTAGTSPVADQDGTLRHQRGDWAVKGRPNPDPANGPANATVTPAAPVVAPNAAATTPTPAPPARTILRDDDSATRSRDRDLNRGPAVMRGPSMTPPAASAPMNRGPSPAPAPAAPPMSRPVFTPGPATSGPAGGMRSAGAEHGSRGSSSSRSANPK